jgi:hypothetical protein
VPNLINTENHHIRLKISLLIVAASFFAYSIYWLANGVIWGYNLTRMLLHISQIAPLASMGNAELTALFIQEYCSVVNSFVLLFCGLFAAQSAISYFKNNPNYLQKLRRALILIAVFSLLLVPASLHHLLGVAYGWFMVDIYVGLSYLLQALLIVPSLLILSQKMRNPQNHRATLKWAMIAGSLFIFALWLKYLFLWLDTLMPMNTQVDSIMNTVGTVNSLLTLLIAGAITMWGCFNLNRNRPNAIKILSVSLILVGFFFLIFTAVSVFVPIYASFWYLTDFWMLTLPILGLAVLTSLQTHKVKEYHDIKRA